MVNHKARSRDGSGPPGSRIICLPSSLQPLATGPAQSVSFRGSLRQGGLNRPSSHASLGLGSRPGCIPRSVVSAMAAYGILVQRNSDTPIPLAHSADTASPADVCFGKAETVHKRRKKIKTRANEKHRLLHRQTVAQAEIRTRQVIRSRSGPSAPNHPTTDMTLATAEIHAEAPAA